MRKALSLFLVAIMLLTMIPMGAIGIFATDVDDDLVVDKEAAEGQTYYIDGPKDWNRAAASGDEFKGDTIVIRQWISSATAQNPDALNTIPVFRGVLDGNDQNISNAAFDRALLTTVGLKGVIEDVTVKDLTISNVAVNGNSTYAGVLAGYVVSHFIVDNVDVIDCSFETTNSEHFTAGTMSDIGAIAGMVEESVGQLTVTNCDVEDFVITTTAEEYGSSSRGVGLLVRRVYHNTKGAYIENCNVSGSINHHSRCVGGLVGAIEGAAVGKTNVSPITIKKVTIDAELTTTMTGNSCAGLIVGTADAYNTNDWTVLINGVKATGTVTANYAGGAIGKFKQRAEGPYSYSIEFKNLDIDAEVNGIVAAGGFAGTVGEAGQSHNGIFTVENSVFAGSVNIPAGSAVHAGAFIGDHAYAGQTLKANNCVFSAAVEGDGAPLKPNLVVADTTAATGSKIVLNGCVTNYGANFYVIGGAEGAVTGTVASVENANINNLIKKDANGFITFIGVEFNAIIEGQTKTMSVGYVDEYALPTAKSKGKVCIGWKVNGATEVTPVGAGVDCATLATIEAVFDTVMSKAWVQLKANSNNTQDIRVVGLIDSIRYSEIGYDVTIKYTEGGQQKTKTQENFKINNVYESLTADYGTEVITTEDFGMGEGNGYLTSFVIKNVPTNVGQVVIELTPYQVQLTGAETTGQKITITLNDGVVAA